MSNTAAQKSVTLISKNEIYPHQGFVTTEMRNHRHGHRSGVIWLTGLSGSGKSTIATAVEEMLFNQGYMATVLDGDTMRSGLCADLDFSAHSREENLRRAGEVSSMFAKSGNIVIASFISPHHNGREIVRNIVRDDFHLIHVHASVEDCVERDPKGLYKKAMSGGIKHFTGVGQSYEEPQDADLVIDTSQDDVNACRSMLLEYIEQRFCL